MSSERERGDRESVKCAVLRADASMRIGMGHVSRCLAFADGLARRGAGCVFVTRDFDRRVPAVIRSKGYDVEEVPADATFGEDAEVTRVIGERNGALLVITDLCYREALGGREKLDAYHVALAGRFFRVSLAGGQAFDPPADVVVNPYYTTTSMGSVRDGGRIVLLGPSYVILRREFIEAAKVPRRIVENARRVLVTIGGSDELHMTVKVVKALCVLRELRLNLRIVIGPMYSEVLRQETEEILTGFEGEYAVLDHTHNNLAEAMLWADLAITGDGLTKYEAAVTGTPSIMLSRFDSEKAPNDEFEKAGTTHHAGDGGLIDRHILAGKIQDLLKDASRRSLMSQRGRALVDGRGLERVLARIPPEVFR